MDEPDVSGLEWPFEYKCDKCGHVTVDDMGPDLPTCDECGACLHFSLSCDDGGEWICDHCGDVVTVDDSEEDDRG